MCASLSETPVVSVVMPVYNTERYVAEAIESVLAQSHSDFELVIVDDGATDGSYEICRRYLDPRIRIIRQPNRGLPAARNAGIREAKGSFIAFLDSDDMWKANKLELHMLHFKAKPDLGLSYSCSQYIDEEGRPFGNYLIPPLRDITPDVLFRGNPIGNGSTPVVRRQALDDAALQPREGPVQYFDERLKHAEDIECWFRIVLTGRWRVEGIPAPLTRYRLNPRGLSHATAQQRFFSTLAIDYAGASAPDVRARCLSYRRANCDLYFARNYLYSKQPKKAASCLLRVLRREPRVFGLKQVPMIGLTLLQYLSPSFLYERVEAGLFRLEGMRQRRKMERDFADWKKRLQTA